MKALSLAALCILLAAAPVRVTLDVRGAQLNDVIALLAAESGRNIVTDDSVKPQLVSLNLHDVSFDDALTVLVKAYDLQVRSENGVLIVGSAEAMNRRYGYANDPRSPTTVVLALKRARPDEIAPELTAALPQGTVIVPDRRTGSVIVTGNSETIERAKTLTAALDAPEYHEAAGVAHVYPLRYLKPSEVAGDLKGIVPDGSYLADDAQNAIVVSGNDDVQRTASSFIASLDVPSAQVLFEVRVADVQPQNDQSDVGIEFGGYDLAGSPIAGAATYAFAGNSIAINARLNALVSKGRARILATPKLVTMNNREADLLIGQTYPVVYYDAHYGGQQVQFVDIGVKLRLTPTIGTDGSVRAEMHPEYSAIQGFVAGYPVIANRKVDSVLRVGDGQTIVLGGLLRDVDMETISKLPGLADIPVLGKLFQDRRRTRERDEVVFLITPHVLYPKSSPPSQ